MADPDILPKSIQDEISRSIQEFESRKIYDSFDEATLASIPDDKLEQAIIDYVWLKIGDDVGGEFERVTALPFPYQIIYTTFLYEGEIHNGGFNQYFWNSTSQFALVTIEALKALGAIEHAELLSEAIETFRREEPQQRRFYELNTNEAFAESYEHTDLNKLDKRFYAMEELGPRRIAYIRSNLSAFCV